MPNIIILFALLFSVVHHVPAAAAADANERRVVIALDPGHGGSDPGAEAMDVNEADLVLDFALRLRAILEKGNAVDVVLTRDGDEHVPLDKRLSRARSGGAGVFVSIHADALAPGDGQASGITLYTLDASDVPRANARLIVRHDQEDILTGVNLTGTGEDVAFALVDLARQETQPRSQALARSLLTTFAAGDVRVNNRPHRHGGFAVLKAADMPSILIELGFLSNARDRERLLSEDWLEQTAWAIRDGLMLWISEDAVFEAQTLQ